MVCTVFGRGFTLIRKLVALQEETLDISRVELTSLRGHGRQNYWSEENDLRLYLASLLVLLAATLRPAIRARKTEPMEALRTE